MKIKAVLFDLDGTLLPLDQDEFIKTYFALLASSMKPHGYEPKQLVESTWKGTAAMIANDGSKNNSEAFWDVFTQIYGAEKLCDMELFDAFYRDTFGELQPLTSPNPMAASLIRTVKESGFRTVLATNPVFPQTATLHRMRWAGLAPEDFELYTTYENIGYCKPNLEYYREIARRLGVEPSECAMVGNDVNDDLVAERLGMQVFLLTDHLVNRKNVDISRYARGGFAELATWLNGLLM